MYRRKLVFTQEEVKQIVWKKWIFPDFTNKLTWLVGGAGVTVILTPTVFKSIFSNWLVDTFNLNAGEHYTLAELQSSTPDYWLGFGLVFLALVHNLGYRLFIYKSEKKSQFDEQRKFDVDRKLFNEFIELLPSGGLDVKLLEEHDFSNSHSKKQTDALDTFVHTWNNAQKQFLDEELESKRDNLINKSRLFIYTLANNSYSVGSGEMFSCIPDAYRGEWDYPSSVHDKIRELNTLGTELFELHKDLVLTARRKLRC